MSINNNKGFTLVELLVATTISIFVITASITVFIDAKKHYSDINNATEQNVRALTVEEAISGSLLNVGYGCNASADSLSYSDESGDNADMFANGPVSVGVLPFTSPLIAPNLGIKQGCTGSLCAEADSNYIAIARDNNVSEILSVNGVNVSVGEIFANLLNINQYVVSCDASTAYLMKVANKSSSDIRMNGDPSVISAGEYIGDYELIVYLIRGTGRLYDDGSVVNALYMYKQKSSGRAKLYELIDQVSNLKVQIPESITMGEQISWRDISSDTAITNSTEIIKISYDVTDKNGNIKNFSNIMPIRIY